jgi:hypothetical protein
LRDGIHYDFSSKIASIMLETLRPIPFVKLFDLHWA